MPLAFPPEAGYMWPQMKAVILAAGKGTRMGELTGPFRSP